MKKDSKYLSVYYFFLLVGFILMVICFLSVISTAYEQKEKEGNDRIYKYIRKVDYFSAECSSYLEKIEGLSLFLDKGDSETHKNILDSDEEPSAETLDEIDGTSVEVVCEDLKLLIDKEIPSIFEHLKEYEEER